jgi:RNA polymerase sigma-70 factor (ECF subfamily)
MQSPSVQSETELLRRLRAGDERAFAYLVERYHDSMRRVASAYVPSRVVAEEVVQDTWLAVFRGFDKFQGQSSLRTWLFTILVNRARTVGTREHRGFPIADNRPAVDSSRFGPDGAWISPPEQWIEEAEDRFAANRIAGLLRAALDSLPPRQREIVTLRDLEGMSSEEACTVLGISEANQRVLLHRGRNKLRQILEAELRELRMPDNALAALASAGGTAFVAAMVTDAWAGLRDRVARLLGRGDAKAEAAVLARLEESRVALAAATADNRAAGRVRQELEAAWRNRLEDFLQRVPASAKELRALVAEGLAAATVAGQVSVKPAASGPAQQAVLRRLGDEIPRSNLSGPGKPGANLGPERTGDGERARSAAGQYGVLAYSRVDQALVVLLDAPPATAVENLERPAIEGTIDVNAYLDTEDAVQASLVSRALDALGRLLGYDGPHDETIVRGSIWRRAKALLRRGIDADEAMKLRMKLEHAAELVIIGERQAKVDQAEAEALSTTLASIADIPSACLVVGSLLIVKYIDSHGPLVLVRPLSAVEMRTWERCPGIQRDPRTALEMLATAMAALEGADEGSS